MTAQQPDIYIYKGQHYSYITEKDKRKATSFHPNSYGITPASICSNCSSGYFCEFEVINDKLVLQTLQINSKDNTYPAINGVLPLAPNDAPGYTGYHVYKDLQLPVAYTNSLIIGNGFLSKYYIHTGFQHAWAYRNVLELTFKEGQLMGQCDHSSLIEQLQHEKCQELLTYTENWINTRHPFRMGRGRSFFGFMKTPWWIKA
ncbi:MAG: hypothetical protein Q4G58_04725 [bacterium]|nr:hypothetical protein [bacterium]